MKLIEKTLYSLVSVFIVNDNYVYIVRSAPMNPGQESPPFGTPFEEHLGIPTTTQSNDGYNNPPWNVPMYNYPAHDAHLHYPNHHLFDHTMHETPMFTWDQGYLADQGYATTFQPLIEHHDQHHFQNTENFNNAFNQDLLLGELYSNHHFDDAFAQGIQHGHSSLPPLPLSPPRSTNLFQYPSPSQPTIPTRSASPPPDITTLSHFARQELPKEILDARHERLNKFEWQRRYHQSELLSIYEKIANVWGSISRTTMVENLFPRLNKYLRDHPQQIDRILADDRSAIEEAARESGKRHDKSDCPPSASMYLMTPKKFVDWIVNANHHATSTSTSTSQDSAFTTLNIKPRGLIVNRLVAFWGVPKEVVEELLKRITEAEFAPYRSAIMARTRDTAERGAKNLRDYFLHSKNLDITA